MIHFLIIISLTVSILAVIAVLIGKVTDEESLASSIKSVAFYIITFLLILLAINYDFNETEVKENAVVEFINGSVTYDTLSMDKDGNVLKIKLNLQ